MLCEASVMQEPPVMDGSLRQAYFINRCRKITEEREQKLGRPLTFCVVTFGCQMNERDSEKLRGILSLSGFHESASEDADFVLYNTCTVRENANVRLYGRLGALSPLRKKNPGMKIALCGCMMQEKDEIERIRQKYRYVSLVFGTHNLYRFAELMCACLMSDDQIIDVADQSDAIVENLPVERTYSFKSGVNIMFGCNNFCTYCIVPYVRGREKSREPKEILREIEHLSADGVIEIMLLGQNVNSYGKGLSQEITFAQLLKEAARIDGIERIRFMTSHPKDLSDELIDVMASCSKICPHLHLPVQSGSSRLLKKMNRHYTKESYLALVRRLRERIPDLSLSTDLIVGFPGKRKRIFFRPLTSFVRWNTTQRLPSSIPNGPEPRRRPWKIRCRMKSRMSGLTGFCLKSRQSAAEGLPGLKEPFRRFWWKRKTARQKDWSPAGPRTTWWFIFGGIRL